MPSFWHKKWTKCTQYDTTRSVFNICGASIRERCYLKAGWWLADDLVMWRPTESSTASRQWSLGCWSKPGAPGGRLMNDQNSPTAGMFAYNLMIGHDSCRHLVRIFPSLVACHPPLSTLNQLLMTRVACHPPLNWLLVIPHWLLKSQLVVGYLWPSPALGGTAELSSTTGVHSVLGTEGDRGGDPSLDTGAAQCHREVPLHNQGEDRPPGVSATSARTDGGRPLNHQD